MNAPVAPLRVPPPEPVIPEPPPPPPQTPQQQQALESAIALAERQRGAAGGAPALSPTEIPHPVQPTDTLTAVAGTYQSPLPGIIGANPQVANPNLINPGQVVFVPTTDQPTIDTRTQVAEAEQADSSVASLESVANDPAFSQAERRLARDDLATARGVQSTAWGEVRAGVEGEIRAAGETATFPVDQAVAPTVEGIRARAPESPGFQREVTAAQQTVDQEWRETRTTGAQLEELTTAAYEQDEAVTNLEAASTDPSLAPGERRAAADDLATARTASGERWNEVQAAVQRELRFAGGDGPLPDQAAAPTLEAIQGTQPDDARFQQEVGEANQALEAEWREQSTTTTELDQLTQDVQAAESSLASIEEMASSGDQGERGVARAELPSAQQHASETRARLRDELAGTLRTAGEGQAFPEETTLRTTEELRTALPDDPNVRGLLDDARTTVTEEWRTQGWTRDTLGVATEQYDQASAAQADLDAARGDPGRAAEIPGLEATAARERGEALGEAQRQIQGAADAVPPEQAEAAATGRALILATHGSQDAAFQGLVDEAHTAVVVTPRVEAVAAAYESGGGREAAAELERQTGGTTSPETAERVVLGSMPTIDRITADLGQSTGPGDPIEWDGGRGPSDTFHNLSVATDRASQSNNGQMVADEVARSVIESAPGGVSYPPYTWGVTRTVAEGGGATLPAAMARELQAQGKPEDAEILLGSVREGLDVLRGRAEDAVANFQEATETIVQLRRDWSGIMSPQQVDDATVRYVEQNPEVLENFNRSYGDLENVGYDLQRAALSLDDEALATLDGLGNLDELRTTRNEVVNDPNAQIAMAESQLARQEVIQSILTADTAANGGLPGQNNPALINQGRGSVKEIGNSLLVLNSASSAADAGDLVGNPNATPTGAVADVFGPRQVTLDPAKVTNFAGAMNGLGFAFNGLAAQYSFERIASGDGVIGDYAKAAYYSMGFAKEGAEGLAFMTARGWLGNLHPAAAGPGAQRLAASVLPGINTEAAGLSRLTSQPGWIKFGTFVKTVGTVIDAGYAIDALAGQDYPAAALYATSATGGGLMTLSGIGAIGAWGGPVGAGAVLLAGGTLWLYKDAQAKAQFEEPSREFLQAAGLRPEIAEQLANYDDNDGEAAGPALAAAMREFGVDPANFIDTLNGMTPDQVEQITDAAQTVDSNDQGAFPVTSDTDYQVWGPEDKDPTLGGHYLYDPDDQTYRGTYTTGGGPYPIPVTEPNPRSLTALRDYARAVTGGTPLG